MTRWTQREAEDMENEIINLKAEIKELKAQVKVEKGWVSMYRNAYVEKAVKGERRSAEFIEREE